MIEVNLYSVSAQDPNTMIGRCVARSRFDKEGMGVGIMEFVKGFLKNNLDKFENGIGNSEVVEFINSDLVMNTSDLASVNYFLQEVGYKVQIQNVADDEENSTGVPSGEIIEWNVIDRNFVQYDYPTATKIIPAPGSEIPETLRRIVENSNFFNEDKFSGLVNPLTELLDNLDKMKLTTGSVSSGITTKIYSLLDQLGITVFCATSED